MLDVGEAAGQMGSSLLASLPPPPQALQPEGHRGTKAALLGPGEHPAQQVPQLRFSLGRIQQRGEHGICTMCQPPREGLGCHWDPKYTGSVQMSITHLDDTAAWTWGVVTQGWSSPRRHRQGMRGRGGKWAAPGGPQAGDKDCAKALGQQGIQ